MDSDESVLVPWEAPPLRSRERRAVRVRVWGPDGDGPSPWSDEAVVEAGLLDPADWTAELVAPAGDDERPVDGPARLLRRDFALRDGVASARLYVTAHGVYEVELNGVRVGDHALAPGWTSYAHRLRYQTFDVTALLRAGANAIGAQLADGWFRGRFGFEGGISRIYGERVALLAQLEVAYDDGTTERLGTDGEWRSAEGPITAASLYDGESYDARRERDGWSSPGYDATGWSPVAVEPLDAARLVAPTGPPVRCTEVVEPVAITTSPSGQDDRRLRAEPRRPAAPPRGGRGRAGRHAAPRRGPARTASLRPAPAPGARHRHLRAARHGRRGGVGAPLHLPRLPLRRGHRLAGRDRAGRDRRRVLPHRHGAHGLVRVLGSAARALPRQRRLGDARQLPRRADRLPAARRAPRVDGRPADLRADRVVPLRLRGDGRRRGCATWRPTRARTATCPCSSRSSRWCSAATRSSPRRSAPRPWPPGGTRR